MKSIDKNELRQLVENNPKLVYRKKSTRYPNLYVLKYSREVFYDALWDANPLLVECRGLVVDEDYNVIVKPFTKIFNYQENGTTIDMKEHCDIVKKVNGFMGCATYNPKYSDKLIISTTGSLDSEHAVMAYKHIKPYEDKLIVNATPGQTFLFEICDKEDPHIIDEEEGAYLIGSYTLVAETVWFRVAERFLDRIADIVGCPRPYRIKDIEFRKVLELIDTCQHEGYMVVGNDSGTELKIKSPYYLVTKFLARAAEKKLIATILSGDRKLAYSRIDEEYYPLIDSIIEAGVLFSNLQEQDRIAYIRRFLEKKRVVYANKEHDCCNVL